MQILGLWSFMKKILSLLFKFHHLENICLFYNKTLKLQSFYRQLIIHKWLIAWKYRFIVFKNNLLIARNQFCNHEGKWCPMNNFFNHILFQPSFSQTTSLKEWLFIWSVESFDETSIDQLLDRDSDRRVLVLNIWNETLQTVRAGH